MSLWICLCSSVVMSRESSDGGFGRKEGGVINLKDGAPMDVTIAWSDKEAACWETIATRSLPYARESHDLKMLQYINRNHPGRQNSKRVAFVIRGAMFRAANYSGRGESWWTDDIEMAQPNRCDKGAWTFQQMAIASQLLNIIVPLESFGYKVDIFTANFPCKEHPEWEELVRTWYGGRIVAHTTCDEDAPSRKERVSMPTSKITYDQGACWGTAYKLFTDHAMAKNLSYDFSIMWRYDVQARNNVSHSIGAVEA